ncbi:Ni/Fe-hydrogenase, b-type cytochrome subunit [Actinomadura sp. ATCC 31491]|uniref:Ni/Fe-hydrogenase, b-type cytochrome subunit n=1 Tax=Actinomadura luzonensis TaxID=2805427 RepID=A0ABT0FX96_9ACTN|nr:Ni/Fe-hydrogenase, b-type cytochrome subunit [Actinomadura luzonensis]MCK2216952.1 Ni/Fe-hydrogenase, b-type cytochrome subunit [Actinomadura luzonensis]
MTTTSNQPPAREGRVAVRVWQLPVRIIHWLLAASIVVLSLTGLYIGVPVLSPDGRHTPIMAYAHAVHVGAGLVFAGLLLARVIFAFTGNRYARWDQFLPVRKEQRRMLKPSLRFYLFLSKEPPPATGHNPLAGLTYTVLFAMFLAQTFTGLALEAAEDRTGWTAVVSGWVDDLAPLGAVRFTHHLILWLTWGFVIHHVYSAVLMDNVERSGLVSSMITGIKHLPEDRDA